MTARMILTTNRPRHDLCVEELIEAFEEIWNRDGEADVADFFPVPDHPEFISAVTELLCVDFERRWRRLRPKRIEVYLAEFRELLAHPSVLEQLAFEEYRLRAEGDDFASPHEYASRFKITTDHWPQRKSRGDESTQGDLPDLGHESTSLSLHFADQLERLTVDLANWPSAPGKFLEFTILEPLGQGKFGRVYLASQAHLSDRLVVIKVTTDFWCEAERLARLQHTNIVPIYSVHQEQGLQAVCMPFCGRKTLRDLLQFQRDPARRSGAEVLDWLVPTPPAATCRQRPSEDGGDEFRAFLKSLSSEAFCLWLMARIAGGVGHAHDRGILHRDLKPANILLSDEGQPMILDFNLSDDVVAGGAATLLVGGTLPYMAPEQLRSIRGEARIDHRSDIYALGVILFEMLTGQLPSDVPQGNVSQRLDAMLRERSKAVPRASQLNPRVSPAMDSILQRCLTPDVTRRYATARQLKEDLDRQLNHLPLRHAPDRSPTERIQKWLRRHPRLTSSGGVAVLAAVILAIVASLLVVRGHRVAALEAMQTYRDLDRLAPHARVLLSFSIEGATLEPLGLESAARVFGLYDVEQADWRRRPSYRYLEAGRQRHVEETLEELLYLVACHAIREAQVTPDAAARAALWRRAARYNEAARRASAATEGSPAVLRQQADIELARGNRREFERVQELAGASPEMRRLDRYLDAIDAAWSGRPRESLERLQALQRQTPQDAGVWFLAGIAHSVLAEFDAAELCFTRCTVLWPECHFAFFHRGVNRLKRGDPAGAADDFSEVLRLVPELSAARFNRAIAYCDLGMFESAERDTTAAIASGMDDCRSYLMRARARRGLGNEVGADQDLHEALQRDAKDAHGWVERGMARLPEDPEAALADLDRALAVDGSCISALDNRAHVLSMYLARADEAIETLDRRLEIAPDNPMTYISRGVLKARRGDCESARDDARAALELEDSAEVFYRTACVYAQLAIVNRDDAEQAVRLLVEAMRRDLRWAEVALEDPLLAPIRDQAETRDLLESVSQLRSAR